MMKNTYTFVLFSLLMLFLSGCDETVTSNVDATEAAPTSLEPIDEETGFGEQNNEDVDITDGGLTVEPPVEGETAYVYLVLESSINLINESEGTIEFYYIEGEEQFRLYLFPERQGVTVYRVSEESSLEPVEAETSTLYYLKQYLEQNNFENIVVGSGTEYTVNIVNGSGETTETYTLNINEGIISDAKIDSYDDSGGVTVSRHMHIQYGLTDEDVALLPSF